MLKLTGRMFLVIGGALIATGLVAALSQASLEDLLPLDLAHAVPFTLLVTLPASLYLARLMMESLDGE